MKFKFRADGDDMLIFGMFALFLFFIVRNYSVPFTGSE